LTRRQRVERCGSLRPPAVFKNDRARARINFLTRYKSLKYAAVDKTGAIPRFQTSQQINEKVCTMSGPDSLKEIYTDEIKDLWSANDQMARVVKTMAQKAHDAKLKHNLEKSIEGITKHTETLKSLLEHSDEKLKPEHCKGMEGLVAEATKHITKEAPSDGDLLDITIIAQYQRMCHYGIAGFGNAAAYATSLGMKDDATALKKIISDIYKSDEYATKLSEKTAKVAAD
jgi:ferritin-like metal-binding protein YciE